MLFLPAGNRPGRALPGAGIGLGTLAPNRQPLPVPQTPVTAEIHQPLDVHGYIPAEIAFDLNILVDIFPDLCHFHFGQIIGPGIQINAGITDNLLRGRVPYTIDIG
jgi:hypothetical protein